MSKNVQPKAQSPPPNAQAAQPVANSPQAPNATQNQSIDANKQTLTYQNVEQSPMSLNKHKYAQDPKQSMAASVSPGTNYSQKVNGLQNPQNKIPLRARDEKDVQIDKLKGINQKLRNKIKELNTIVEKAIEKANQKKLTMVKREQKDQVDVDYLLKVRDKEIENSEKQIKNNQIEIEKLQQKYDELSASDNISKLEDQLRQQQDRKKALDKQIKELEQENIEQGKTLDKITNGQEYQNKIKSLMEDLRMWKDKNAKLESAFAKDKETRQNQMEKIKTLEEKNKKYQSQLQQLKEQKAKQMQQMKSEVNQLQGPMAAQQKSSLPPIQTEEEKQKLRQELEDEYFQQRQEMKKVENKTKALQNQAEELKLKLKEKDTMLRIAKFKLSEVQRNIKTTQLKPIQQARADERQTNNKSFSPKRGGGGKIDGLTPAPIPKQKAFVPEQPFAPMRNQPTKPPTKLIATAPKSGALAQKLEAQKTIGKSPPKNGVPTKPGEPNADLTQDQTLAPGQQKAVSRDNSKTTLGDKKESQPISKKGVTPMKSQQSLDIQSSKQNQSKMSNKK